MKDFEYPTITTYECEELDVETVFTKFLPSEPV